MTFERIQTDLSPLHTWSNGVRVPLSAAVHDDLDWSESKREAERIVGAGKRLFWELDFHLRSFSRCDTSTFFANVRAVEEAARLIAPFASHTFGLCLFRGALDLRPFFPLSEWEEPFCEWLGEKRWPNDEHHYRLFCMECFSDYFHRLISFLPDGLLAFALFDATSIDSIATRAQLLSRERFGYLHTGYVTPQGAELHINGLLRGWVGKSEGPEVCASDPSTALCLPSDPFCDQSTLHALDAWIATASCPFRILCEEKLTEEWEGVDRLIVPSLLSPQGVRKLQGFRAAGGEVVQI